MRLFPPFPDGRSGIGLLLLRCSTAGAMLSYFYAPLKLAHPVLAIAYTSVEVVASCLLLMGFLSPPASGVSAMAAISAFFLAAYQPDMTRLSAQLHTVLTIALNSAVVLLGPGAYSIDARLFGRRKVIIPAAGTRDL